MVDITNLLFLQVRRPRTQAEIIRNWSGEREPVVSIFCATYNHKNYIQEAIDSFLMQETDFPFEIIIRDDASTDGTTEIVHEYAQRYPDIIRPLVNVENRLCMGERALHALPTVVRGKYCALCEGDDFWISPGKLQKQFELLEKYPQAVMSVARAHYYQQDGDKLHYITTSDDQDKILLDFYDIRDGGFHTSTHLIRTDILTEVIKKYFTGHDLYGDTALRAILITHGLFAFLPEVVSVYRITGTGIWSKLNREQRLRWEFNSSRKLAGMLPGIYGRYQRQRTYIYVMELFRFYVENAQIIETVKIVPSVFWYALVKVPDYIRRKLSIGWQ